MPKEQIFEIKKQEKPEVPEKETEPEIVWSPEAEKEGEKLVMQISSLKESLDQAEEKGDLKEQALILDQITPLIKRLEILAEKEWTSFEQILKLKERYQEDIVAYREEGILEEFSKGQEGIKDENGKEYPVPSIQEIKARLRQNAEFFLEKAATMINPRLLLTPFALSLETFQNKYGELIKTKKKQGKLKGVDGQDLPVNMKEPVYLSDELKKLRYFPKWEKKGNEIKAIGGINKEEAIEQIGGWRILIIEDIPKAPEKGQGQEKEMTTKKGEIKRRKQVEGGLDAAEQYELLKQQNEEGLVPEDWFSFALLYLKKNNVVLDDDQKTNYYCRLLGAVSASGSVPYAYWSRGNRQAGMGGMGGLGPGGRNGDCVVRSAVRV